MRISTEHDLYFSFYFYLLHQLFEYTSNTSR